MKAFTTLLVVVSTLALSTQAVYLRQEKDLTPQEHVVDEMVQGARGFFMGFQSGLYKTEKVDENCLNPEAEAKILELFDKVFKGEIDIAFMLRVVTDLMTITASIESCSTKAVTDLASYCFFDTGKNCELTKLIENIQKNLLIIMGKLTDISTLVLQGLPKDGEQA